MKNTMRSLSILVLTLFFSSSVSGQAEKNNDFDFWVGTWNVYKYGTDSLVGKSQITSMLDGYALLEEYTGASGTYSGKSINKYNNNTGEWEQYYVDNFGLTLHLMGEYDDGKMTLENKVKVDGKTVKNKIVWQKEGDSVRQTWTQKTTGGGDDDDDDDDFKSNWTTLFDGIYKSVRL